MNILFYCPFNFDLKSKNIDQLGGIETLNLELSKMLSNYNHKIYLATYCNKVTRIKNLINIPIQRLSNKNYEFDFIISSNDSKIFNRLNITRKLLWLHNTLAIEKALRKGVFFSIFFNKVNVIPNFLPKIFEKTKKNFDRKKIFVWSVQRDKGLQETLNLWSEKIFMKRKDVKLYIFGIKKKSFKNKLSYYTKRNVFF